MFPLAMTVAPGLTKAMAVTLEQEAVLVGAIEVLAVAVADSLVAAAAKLQLRVVLGRSKATGL